MKINELEKKILLNFFKMENIKVSDKNLEKIFDVESRNLTGVGFLTNFIVNEELKTISIKKSFVSDDSVVVLNKEKVVVGTLVYIESGYISSIEGYTFGKEWPSDIEEINIYSKEEFNKLLDENGLLKE